MHTFLVTKTQTLQKLTLPQAIMRPQTWPQYLHVRPIFLKVQQTYYLIRNLKRKPWVPPMQ